MMQPNRSTPAAMRPEHAIGGHHLRASTTTNRDDELLSEGEVLQG